MTASTQLPQIPFANNWNHKLHCDFFTTIRLKSHKYVIGQAYEITIRKEPAFDCVIVDMKELKLNDISEWIARLDTGLSAKECRQLFIKMYSKSPIDWTTQVLQFILLQKLS
jgi:hypothetical protein